jgi:hypothetical protein
MASLLVASLAAWVPNTSVPLNEWPMIMAHDAATTYLEGGLLHQINNWAKTQADGGMHGELVCGARAFDWRPKIADDGSVVMHHGAVTISHKMDNSLAELTAWAASNGTSANDLVFLGITDCDGSGCAEAVQRLLTQHNITYLTDCSRLHGMSAQQAFELGALPQGGGVLAVSTGSGSNPTTTHKSVLSCPVIAWTDLRLLGRELQPGRGLLWIRRGPHRVHMLLGRLFEDLFTRPHVAVHWQCDVMARRPTASCVRNTILDPSSRLRALSRCPRDLCMPSRALPCHHCMPSRGSLPPSSLDDRLRVCWFADTVQALWEESTDSVVVGELHGSTLLDDERRSGLNGLLAERVTSGVWDVSRINMVEGTRDRRSNSGSCHVHVLMRLCKRPAFVPHFEQ